MSGVVGVVIIMLVVAMLQQSSQALAQAEQTAEQERRAEEDRSTSLRGALGDLASMVDADPVLQTMIAVDPGNGLVTLKQGTFDDASPCLRDEVTEALKTTAAHLLKMMEDHPDYLLSVEGHTDGRNVGFHKTPCGSFDDNYTLSASRAREARKVIIESWPQDQPELAKRVQIAGVGDSKNAPGSDDTEEGRAANRKVIIQVLTTQSPS